MAEVAYPQVLNDSAMGRLVEAGRYGVADENGATVALPEFPAVDPVYRYDVVFAMWVVIEGPQVR